MLKKLYDKSRIWFAVVWIIAYCVLLSAGDSLSAVVGVEKSVTFVIAFILSLLLLVFLKSNGLFAEYGLCKPQTPLRSMLFYVPVLIMLTANFWCGFALNYGVLGTIFYILAMLCVGFLEEVIFRGLLFNAMKKEGVTLAIIVSSITFGIGHILNLLHGTGADLLPNILQVVYATAAGFMFVMIYYKTESLLVCIFAHGIFNAFSAFSNESNLAIHTQIWTAVALTLITGGYAVYLALTLKKTRHTDGK